MLYRLCQSLACVEGSQVLGFMVKKENREDSGAENILFPVDLASYGSKETSSLK